MPQGFNNVNLIRFINRYPDFFSHHNFEIYYQGFRSTFYDLYNAGWQIDVEELQTNCIHFMIQNNDVFAISENISLYDCVENSTSFKRLEYPIRFENIKYKNIKYKNTTNYQVIEYANVGASYRTWEPWEKIAQPIYKIKTFNEFHGYQGRKIILPETDVQEILNIILEKQQPDRTKYYEDKVATASIEAQLWSIKE